MLVFQILHSSINQLPLIACLLNTSATVTILSNNNRNDDIFSKCNAGFQFPSGKKQLAMDCTAGAWVPRLENVGRIPDCQREFIQKFTHVVLVVIVWVRR